MSPQEELRQKIEEARSPAELYPLLEKWRGSPSAALVMIARHTRVWDDTLFALMLSSYEALLFLLENPHRPDEIAERIGRWLLGHLDSQASPEERKSRLEVLRRLAERGHLSPSGEATGMLLERIVKRPGSTLTLEEKQLLDIITEHSTLGPEQLEPLVDGIRWGLREQPLPWVDMTTHPGLTPSQRRRMLNKVAVSSLSFTVLETLVSSPGVRADSSYRSMLVQQVLREGAMELLLPFIADGVEDDCAALFHIALDRGNAGNWAAQALALAPEKVAPHLDERDLEKLLRSSDASVRLTAIAAAGMLRKRGESVPPPSSPSPQR